MTSKGGLIMFIRVFGVYALMTLSVFFTIFLIWFVCLLIKRLIRKRSFKKGLSHFSETIEKAFNDLSGGGENETKEINTSK